MGGKGVPPQGDNGFEGGNRFPGGNPLDMDKMQNAFKIIQDAGSTITDEVKAKLKELGSTDNQISMLKNMRKPDNMGNIPGPGQNISGQNDK